MSRKRSRICRFNQESPKICACKFYSQLLLDEETSILPLNLTLPETLAKSHKYFHLTSTLAGSDITYVDEWSLRRPFSFNRQIPFLS